MDSNDRLLVISRQVRAAPEAVFDAWTDPEVLRQWWGLKEATCPEVRIDLRVGGRYSISNRLADGTIVRISGVYETIIRPEKLIYTWSVDGGAEEKVHVSFERDGDGTRLTIRHEGITTSKAFAGHERGWNDSLERIQSYLQ